MNQFLIYLEDDEPEIFNTFDEAANAAKREALEVSRLGWGDKTIIYEVVPRALVVVEPATFSLRDLNLDPLSNPEPKPWG